MMAQRAAAGAAIAASAASAAAQDAALDATLAAAPGAPPDALADGAVVAALVALPAAVAPPATATPNYWDDACKHLQKRDRVLKKLIPKFGQARLTSRGDAFTTLARSIVGQQISVKAAQAVWDRFAACVEGATTHLPPAAVQALPLARMREAGLSARKCEYLLDLARHFADGSVHVGQWQAMHDEAIITELIAIRGIGRWTAEMFLIFHLLRPNVLPLDDLGLLKGISLNYFSGESVSRAEAREVAEAWAPYRSVATWYIWRSLDPLPVEY